MNKYELALVVNAKIEDDERAATVEKAKGGEKHQRITEKGRRNREIMLEINENLWYSYFS